jgi:hypothetical protein
VVPKFTALQVKWDSGIDIDWDFFKFRADHIQVNANLGGAWVPGNTQLAKPYVDFQSSFGPTGLAVPAGDSTINLDFETSVLGVSIGHALLNVGDFFQIEGSFAFTKSTAIPVDVATGLSTAAPLGSPAATRLAQLRSAAGSYLSTDGTLLNDLPMDVVSFGASNVTIVVGDTSDPFFTLDDIDIGFAVFRASTTLSFATQIPRMYAMKAHWANPLDVDWGFMQLQVQDLDVTMNQGGNWSTLQVAPHIDFQHSFGADGYSVDTGGDPIALDFTQSTIGVSVGHALIRIDDFIYIEGGFSLQKSSSVPLDIKTGSAVFVGTYAGRSDRAPTFKPYIGCMPMAGGGARVPTSAGAFKPGQPVTRRVVTVRVRPGSKTVAQRCARGERLVGSSFAFAFATRTPPTASLVSSVSGSQAANERGVAVRVRGDAELSVVRAFVLVLALCSRSA